MLFDDEIDSTCRMMARRKELVDVDGREFEFEFESER